VIDLRQLLSTVAKTTNHSYYYPSPAFFIPQPAITISQITFVYVQILGKRDTQWDGLPFL